MLRRLSTRCSATSFSARLVPQLPHGFTVSSNLELAEPKPPCALSGFTKPFQNRYRRNLSTSTYVQEHGTDTTKQCAAQQLEQIKNSTVDDGVMALFTSTTHGTPADILGLPHEVGHLQEAVAAALEARYRGATNGDTPYPASVVRVARAAGTSDVSIQIETLTSTRAPISLQHEAFLVLPPSNVMKYAAAKELICWESAVWRARCAMQRQEEALHLDTMDGVSWDIVKRRLHEVLFVGKAYVESEAMKQLGYQMWLVREVLRAEGATCLGDDDFLPHIKDCDVKKGEQIVGKLRTIGFVHHPSFRDSNDQYSADSMVVESVMHSHFKDVLVELIEHVVGRHKSEKVPTLLGMRGVGKSRCLAALVEALRCVSLLRPNLTLASKPYVVMHIHDTKMFLLKPHVVLSNAVMNALLCSPLSSSPELSELVARVLSAVRDAFPGNELMEYALAADTEKTGGKLAEKATTPPPPESVTMPNVVHATQPSQQQPTRMAAAPPPPVLGESATASERAIVKYLELVMQHMMKQFDQKIDEAIEKVNEKIDENTKKIDENTKKIEENTKKIDENTKKIDENTKKIDVLSEKSKISELHWLSVADRFGVFMTWLQHLLEPHAKVIFVMDQVDHLQPHQDTLDTIPSHLELVKASLRFLAASESVRLVASATSAYVSGFNDSLANVNGVKRRTTNIKPLQLPRPDVDAAVFLCDATQSRLVDSACAVDCAAHHDTVMQAVHLLDFHQIMDAFGSRKNGCRISRVAVLEVIGEIEDQLNQRYVDLLSRFPNLPPLGSLLAHDEFPKKHAVMVDERFMAQQPHPADPECVTLQYTDCVREALTRAALSRKMDNMARIPKAGVRFELLVLQCFTRLPFKGDHPALGNCKYGGSAANFTSKMFDFDARKSFTCVDVPQFHPGVDQYICRKKGRAVLVYAIQCTMNNEHNVCCKQALADADAAVLGHNKSTVDVGEVVCAYVTPLSQEKKLSLKHSGACVTFKVHKQYNFLFNDHKHTRCIKREYKGVENSPQPKTETDKTVSLENLHQLQRNENTIKTTGRSLTSGCWLMHNGKALGWLMHDGKVNGIGWTLHAKATADEHAINRGVCANEHVDAVLELLALLGVGRVVYEGKYDIRSRMLTAVSVVHVIMDEEVLLLNR